MTTRPVTEELVVAQFNRLRTAALVTRVHVPGPWSGTTATGKA
jgi:hypothetical protein